MFRLKQNCESFTVVDGEFVGKTFVSGILYDEIPDNESHRFDSVVSRAADAKPAAAVSKQYDYDVEKEASNGD